MHATSTEDQRYILGRERSKMVSPIALIAGPDPQSSNREEIAITTFFRSSFEAHSAKVLVGPNEGRIRYEAGS